MKNAEVKDAEANQESGSYRALKFCILTFTFCIHME